MVLTALYSNPGLSSILDYLCDISTTLSQSTIVETDSLLTTRQRYHRLSAEQVDELAKLYEAGQSVPQLSKRFNINRTTVMTHLERQGIARRPATRKMTDAQARRAAKYHQAGESLTKIAARFNVDRATIAKELRRAGQLDDHA